MNYEVTGKLIYKEATQKISDRFQKREFVIEVENEKNPQWNDFVKVQLIQDRCDLLETIQLNENIKVYFNLRGRKWENNGQVSYFTNLEGWRIEKVQAETPMMGAPGTGIQSGGHSSHAGSRRSSFLKNGKYLSIQKGRANIWTDLFLIS